MGKSIKGKELGKGITQRKSDGLYQGRFVNRFGKTQTIYASNELGWRKLTSLNLIIMQNALNELVSDNARKNTKKILVDMTEKAIDSDLLTKNVAKQLNTVISKEDKKEDVY